MGPENPHIDTLIPLCLQGNRSAQLTVYNRFYKAMYNTSLRIVKDSALAEDVMQESFLNAFTKLDTFKGEASFGAWLKRIVVNNSIRHYHKQQQRQEVGLGTLEHKLEDNPGCYPDADLQEQKAKQVLETMKLLKDSYRVSLTLHLIEGYDYEEIGEILNISHANCRTLISRAKESLRNKLMALPK